MNSMDVYDYEPIVTSSKPSTESKEEKGPNTSTSAPAVTTEQPNLNDEVQAAFGSLSKFWGGFRKQVRCPYTNH